MDAEGEEGQESRESRQNRLVQHVDYRFMNIFRTCILVCMCVCVCVCVCVSACVWCVFYASGSISVSRLFLLLTVCVC
jgi:magnesium-transporting ATPase (P-type)